MKKFPVTSENGSKYLIEISKCGSTSWICKVYKPIYVKGIKVWSKLVDIGKYGESFENDFIRIAKRAIEDYEDIIASQSVIIANKNKFKDWDGQL